MLKKILDNQQGAALVAGMLILVSLTLLGIGGLTLTSIDTQISRNYRTSVQAVELANAVVAQMIYWFNNPTTFTDTTVGSYLGGTNSSEKGTNFFAKRRPSGITKSFFTSNGSQFYDVNGDNSTLASESSRHR
jgi:Tfp pilus assembly protein PilX